MRKKDLRRIFLNCGPLDHIDRSLFKIVGPDNTDGKKYGKAYQYLLSKSPDIFYAEIGFFLLLKEFALYNAKTRYDESFPLT